MVRINKGMGEKMNKQYKIIRRWEEEESDTNRWKGRQTRKDGQTNKQIELQKDRQTDTRADIDTSWWANTHTHTHTHTHAHTHTHKHTHTHTHTHARTHTHTPTNR